MVALFVLLTIIVLLTIDYFVQRAEIARAKSPADVAAWTPARAAARAVSPQKPIPIDRVPQGVFLDPGHVWLQLEPSGAFRVGTDFFPVAMLGRPDRVEVRPAGTEIRRGDPLLTLRRGAREVILRSPVDGVISKVNTEAQNDPSRLQEDPFGKGWMYWLTPTEVAPALKRLLVAEDATSWVRQQVQKLRDFMVAGFANGQLVGATLQDGGLPMDGLSEHLDDKRWDSLVAEFFPTVR